MNEPQDKKPIIKIEEEPLDTWYKEMGSRVPRDPEDEPFLGLMVWVDYMIEYN
jgi:hypothetical protein